MHFLAEVVNSAPTHLGPLAKIKDTKIGQFIDQIKGSNPASYSEYGSATMLGKTR